MALSKAKRALIDVVVADKGILRRKEYKSAKLYWDRPLVLEIMRARAGLKRAKGRGSADKDR